MTSLLVVDIGNTTIRLGLWDGVAVQEASAVPTGEVGRALELGARLLEVASGRRPGAALSTVVPGAEAAWERWCQQRRRPLFVVRGDTRTPLINRYRQPERLGPDRLAGAVAAVRRRGAPVIVVHLGTATVVDAVSERREYLGGAIVAGVDTGLAALAEETAGLPRVEARLVPGPIGPDTETGLRAGASFGAAALVEGMVARLRRAVGRQAPVVMTGGHADLVAACLDEPLASEHEVAPTLVLEGIGAIWEYRQSQEG